MYRIEHLKIFIGQQTAKLKHIVDLTEAKIAAGEPSPLCQALKANGSDKSLGWHNYSNFYDVLFANLHISRIFEVGLGSNNTQIPSNMGADGIPGASLRAWRDILDNALVFGADIDRAILFEEERIRTFFVDQTDPSSIKALWGAMPHINFDVMIDDGLHTFEANSIFYNHSYEKINPGGFYIIEDIEMTNKNVTNFVDFFSAAGVNAAIYRLPYDANNIDNAIAIVSL